MFKDLAVQQPDKLTFQTKETIFVKLLDIVGMQSNGTAQE